MIFSKIYIFLISLEYELSDSASSLAMSSGFHDFLKEAEKLNAELDIAKKRDPNLDTLIRLVAVSLYKCINSLVGF